MSNWTNTLNIKDIWEKVENAEMNYSDFLLSAAKRLELIKVNDPYAEEMRLELIADCQVASEDTTEDDVNYFMQALYDWGDISLDGKFGGKKVCWIKTF